jgi:hypothetical protein
MVGGNQVICETTTTTWAAGNTVEAAITPFPDVNGFYYDMANWTAGNGALRGFLNVTNIGARTYGYGISLGQNMPSGSNSDAPIGWDSGIIFQNVNTGVRVITAAKQAMLLGCGADCGGTTDRNGRIAWGNGNDAFIGPNSPNHGIDFQWNTLVAGGTPGLMQGKQASVIGSGSLFELSFNGYLRLVATTFSALPTCAGAIEGAEASLTDANASAFGANITAGGGANHVKAYCNGTNWTVH